MRFLIDKIDVRTLTEFFRMASNGYYMINITKQFSMYIDALRAYAEDFLSVTIPEPDKNWKSNR